MEVLVFHQVLYGLIMFKKKQQLKHLLSSVAAIKITNTLDFISSQHITINSKMTCIENCVWTCGGLGTGWATLGKLHQISGPVFPDRNLIHGEDRGEGDGEQMVELNLEVMATNLMKPMG